MPSLHCLERVRFVVREHARTHIHLAVSSHKYDLCSSHSSPSINEFNSSTSHLESTLLKLVVHCASQNPRNISNSPPPQINMLNRICDFN